MNPKHPFKWRQFQSDIILLCVRWYLRYPLSYRNLEEMMRFEGDSRWTTRRCTAGCASYAPELDKRCRPYLKQTNDSWRVDETYIEVQGEWKYLYRAVDSQGNTLDFMRACQKGCTGGRALFP